MEAEDTIFISALQHYAFCPRQCALIHVEQTYDENLYTLRGQRVHERVNVPDSSLVDGLQVERALPLRSARWGISGIADVVEFLPDGTPYPVEYKAGPRKARLADSIQLCAQAMCLEEMCDRSVPAGAIFHFASKRRREVRFDAQLRSRTEQTIAAVRELVARQQVPAPVADKRCQDCSLLDACMPFVRRDPALRSEVFQVRNVL
ncbi:MAG: CRISPR-associated protein Cas4 [Cyanobacteria bacterium P01_E01_bin.48]